ncbi:MAG: hypothetical protein ACYDAE_00260 [Steroidobacteraceae bacterium]
MSTNRTSAAEAQSVPKVPSNPLIPSNMPIDTVNAAVAVLAYMRDYLTRTRVNVHCDDLEETIEYGRFLMLTAVGQALEHASAAMKVEPVLVEEAAPADAVLQ